MIYIGDEPVPSSKKTRFAILGLLSWQPMSGYDIKKLVEMGLSHFWNESYGQLYPTLNEIVTEGLARKSSRSRGKRARHVFTITPKGRREFQAWLAQPTDPPRVRNEFQLKFFLSSRRAPRDAIGLLTDYRRQQRELHGQYVASEHILSQAVRNGTVPRELRGVLNDGSREQLLFFLLTLRHGILAVEARIAWCDEALQVLHEDAEPGDKPDRSGDK